jgi:hypothetical protein
MVFDGINDCLINTANNASIDIITQPLYLNALYTPNETGNNAIVNKVLDVYYLTQYAMEQAVDSNLRTATYLSDESASLATAGSSVLNVQSIVSSSWKNNAIQMYIKGEASGVAGAKSNNLTSRPNLTLGARSSNTTNTSQNLHFKCKISEIHIAKITNQTALIADQKSYYGIT